MNHPLKYIAAVAAAVFLMVGLAVGNDAVLQRCIDATCRVQCPSGQQSSVGSGAAIAEDAQYIYVLTAGHVAGSAKQAWCTFWQNGHESVPLAGEVVDSVNDQRSDLAVVRIPRAAFGSAPPQIVPLASANRDVAPGETVFSVGCAEGAWATAWQGHALGAEQGRIRFTPLPANGRSGSALYNKDGQVIGVIEARSSDGGYAVSRSAMFERFGVSCAGPKGLVPVQCPGGQCPTPQSPAAPQYRLLPYRQRQEYQNQQNANPYPTLPLPAAPLPAPVAPAAPVDLSGLEGRLDRNAELIQQGFDRISDALEKQQAPLTPIPEANNATIPVVPPPPDPRLDKIDAHDTAIADVNGRVDQLGAALTVVNESMGTLAGTVGKLTESQEAATKIIATLEAKEGTIGERIRARIEEAKAGGATETREVVHSVVKGILGDYGLIVGIPFAAILGFLIRRDVKDKRETGDPLFIEKVVERVRDRVGSVRERISGGDVEPAK